MTSTTELKANRETRMDRYPSRIAAKPEWQERKDPVVYSEWQVNAPLSQEQTAAYERNGYLVITDLFAPEEIKGWREELKSLQHRYEQEPAQEAAQKLQQAVDEVIREPGGNEVRSIFAIHRSNEVFRRVANHPKLKPIVDFLLGSETYIHQSRINYKPGFNGKEFYWHSDFETWHVEDGMPAMRALSCSIALEDNYTTNGPLMLIPGSHKTFVSCVGQTPEEHYRDSLRKQEYGVPDKESLAMLAVNGGGIDTATGPAGSIVLFDCNIMHGSGSNISPYPRSNVFLVYNSVHNRLVEPFSGQKPRPDFIAER